MSTPPSDMQTLLLHVLLPFYNYSLHITGAQCFNVASEVKMLSDLLSKKRKEIDT